MSVMEMSHRGKEFIAIHAEAEALLRELLAVPASYKVLFMQGGAIGENAIVPMNLLRGKASADYIHTGEWSKKSIAEAKRYAKVNVAASAEASGFSCVPPRDTWRLDPDAAYVHICANETIGGVEYHFTPDVGAVPLVADMSSNILSRPVDVARYGLIYGGAQKNIGPAGLTIVIVRDDLIGQAHPFTPSAFDYQQQAANDSMLNTPPTYAIYVAGLVFRWIKRAAAWRRWPSTTASRRRCSTTTSTERAVSQSRRARRSLADERSLQAQGRSARRRFPEGRAGARHGAAEGPPLGRRHARVALQRDADRRRAGAGRLHEGVRGRAWLSGSASWCSTRSRRPGCRACRRRRTGSARTSPIRWRSCCARPTCTRWRSGQRARDQPPALTTISRSRR
jgi:hypothetical protein